MLSRFLNTKARSSQLGIADPLADGAEISDKRSRILMYAGNRDKGDQDTTSRLSPYLSAGVISPRECIRATMTLAGLKKVDAGRTTGIGRWVQELGTCGFTILKISDIDIISSLARLLHECISCLSSSIDGETIPGEISERKMGSQ
jgi:hypothetical protein